MALIIAVGLIGFANWRRGWLAPGIPLAMVGGAVSVAVVFQSLFANRIFAEDQSGALGRLPLLRIAFGMIRDYPVFGVGANNFAVHADDYWLNRGVADWLYVVHNKYLLVASENGLLAAAIFVIFLLVTVRFGYRAWKAGDRATAPIVLCFTAGLLGHMAHANVEIFNDRGQVELLWVMAAMIAVMYRLTMSDVIEDDDEFVEEFVDTTEPSVLVVASTETSWRGSSGDDP